MSTTKKSAPPKKAAAKKAAGKATGAQKPAKKSEVWSDVEKEAMREHARAERRRRSGKVDGEADLLSKIGEMSQADRAIATRIHAIVKEAAPSLAPKTWYGMPAWANADGKVVCFFQAASKFKTRYATFGFSDSASIDDGDMWPVSFGITELTPAGEKRIAALVKKAVAR